MTLPMIDEPATDDADTTPYERRGLYAVAVSEVPSADVEGRRAASVWGVIWRICVCSMELWPVEHRVSVQLSGGF